MIFKPELAPQNFHYDVLYPLYSGTILNCFDPIQNIMGHHFCITLFLKSKPSKTTSFQTAIKVWKVSVLLGLLIRSSALALKQEQQ